MTQVGARKVPAGVAAAVRIGRPRVLGVPGILDDEQAVPRCSSWPLRALRVGSTQSNMSMPRATHSTRSSGMPGSHQVSRPVGRQLRRGVADDVVHDLGRLADAQPADRVAPRTRSRSSPARSRSGDPDTSPPWTMPNCACPGLVTVTSATAPVARSPAAARAPGGPPHRCAPSPRARPRAWPAWRCTRRAPWRCRSRAAPGCRSPLPASAGAASRRDAIGTPRPLR